MNSRSESTTDIYALHDSWLSLSKDERIAAFMSLQQHEAEEFILELSTAEMIELILALPNHLQQVWLRYLPPDDATDLIQAVQSPDEQQRLLMLLDVPTRKEVHALLAYQEDTAGGLMNPRFARLRPDMRVDEAISYFRKQLQNDVKAPETVYYIYVLGIEQQLLGVITFRRLLLAKGNELVRDVMRTDVVAIMENQDQQEVSHIFALYNLPVMPVVDDNNRIKGIVTVDDIVDVFREEATDDIHKFGGVETFQKSYVAVTFKNMYKKRARWLSALFIGEMLTATAMAFFEDEIARAVILALFVPLIISSGGNSGSQASTLIIRAMALEEIQGRDWWRVFAKELRIGLALGGTLGTIGFIRIITWEYLFAIYGQYYLYVATTVFFSLIGVVLFGTIIGSMLPFLLDKLGLDPATSSAPLVATLVDVTGLVIYFTIASIVLTGILL